MKKTKALVNKLLEELEKTPLVQVACDKIGISRNTFYRWMREDRKFLEKASEALSLSTGRANDIAVSNVLSGVQARDVKYTMYWLSHKHPDFRKPFVYKIDANDLLEQKRLAEEKSHLLRIETLAEKEGRKLSAEEIQESEQEIIAWEKRWKKREDRKIEEQAQKLFEEWKKRKQDIDL